jgi:hypothetical protein
MNEAQKMAFFGMHFGKNFESFKGSRHFIVIIGDEGELGNTQRTEVAFIKEQMPAGIDLTLMTLDKYKQSWPSSDTVASGAVGGYISMQPSDLASRQEYRTGESWVVGGARGIGSPASLQEHLCRVQ